MGLFSKKANSGDSLTLIGAEAYFHGLLTVRGSVRVQGKVEGDITDAALVEVGKGGVVRGNVACDSLSVAGEIKGDVMASTQIELLPSARVIGKIRTPRLTIESGAFFDGECAMNGGDSAAAAQEPKAVSARK